MGACHRIQLSLTFPLVTRDPLIIVALSFFGLLGCELSVARHVAYLLWIVVMGSTARRVTLVDVILRQENFVYISGPAHLL